MQVYVLLIEYADYSQITLVFKNREAAEAKVAEAEAAGAVSCDMSDATLIED